MELHVTIVTSARIVPELTCLTRNSKQFVCGTRQLHQAVACHTQTQGQDNDGVEKEEEEEEEKGEDGEEVKEEDKQQLQEEEKEKDRQLIFNAQRTA